MGEGLAGSSAQIRCAGGDGASYAHSMVEPAAGSVRALENEPGFRNGTLLAPRRCKPSNHEMEDRMGRGLLLWLIGIPLPIIILIWLLGGLH